MKTIPDEWLEITSKKPRRMQWEEQESRRKDRGWRGHRRDKRRVDGDRFDL
ncbi:hypothetical protein [Ferrimonas marina]|uniref:Uncharacterized protein n=1 Tax=Ferrimonas marina TaxID=299255 RepID=A0A1M5VTI4_9GAMM|nr:hypothetical protein [Ferrimonas marina]SHH78243.1 hypothetical protein SAMN02745129_2962 [Ferrimonas marina]